MFRFSLKKFIYLTIFLLVFSPLISMFLSYNLVDTTDYSWSEDPKISNGTLDIDISIIPDIDYSSLNDLWYRPKIEMLIITPNRTDFINAVNPLMKWKNEKGVKTIILSNFSLYEGVDDAEKIRNMIKSYYETENIRWVLLVGDIQNAQGDIIPIRNVYNPDVARWGDGRTETIGSELYKPTDYYYADLNGTWNSDGDGNWGESPTNPDNPNNPDNAYGLDEISWDPEVYVGRFPADNANELEIMVNKTLKYEKNPNIGDWMNSMLLAGGISDYPSGSDPDGEFESRLTSYIIENYAINELNYTHLVEEGGNLTQSSLDNYFNNGFSTVLMAGHGLPAAYYRNPNAVGYRSSDASSSTNDYMPSLVYLDACSTSSYDFSDDSIGETLIKKENGGAIGVIGGLRVTWYFENDYNLQMLNRGNAKLFWKEFFINKKFQQGRALYDSKVAYMNSDHYTKSFGSTALDFERKQLLTYCLLGDPELDIYTNKPKIALNPFTEDIYEGQLVSITIKDVNNNVVPYARVHLRSFDGKYHTAYADVNGLVKFRVPAQANELYNVTITGHNLIPSYFNFTTLSDNVLPQLLGIGWSPKSPTISDITTFNIETDDNKSGIECVYVYLSKNNFIDYKYYGIANSIEENNELLSIITERLTPGEYSYFIVSRDYANNTALFYNSDFYFSIPKPIIYYIIPVSLVIVIAIVGISFLILYNGLKMYSHIFK
ncbi:MAG: C25 family cysteine peptidase [Candidatus Hermodarchaeota archaeon]